MGTQQESPNSLKDVVEGNKQERKERKKSPLKKISKQIKKNRKAQRVKPVVFATTMLFMIVALFVYSISYLVAPDFSFQATIKTVRGGYEIVYDITAIPANRFQTLPAIDDIIYVTETGYPSSTTRNSIRMRVNSIENDLVNLSFDIKNVPTFLSTSELVRMASNAKPGAIYQKIKVTGKVMGGRFIADSISFVG